LFGYRSFYNGPHLFTDDVAENRNFIGSVETLSSGLESMPNEHLMNIWKIVSLMHPQALILNPQKMTCEVIIDILPNECKQKLEKYVKNNAMNSTLNYRCHAERFISASDARNTDFTKITEQEIIHKVQ